MEWKIIGKGQLSIFFVYRNNIYKSNDGNVYIRKKSMVYIIYVMIIKQGVLFSLQLSSLGHTQFN
jgi:hypothetical protein